MTLLRVFLVAFSIALVAYTAMVVENHGFNLFPIFFGDIAAMTWPGQFNFDFSGFLTLSALWTMWRERFTAKGFVLGALAIVGGMLFLSIYLLILSANSRTVGALLTGNNQ